MERAIGHKQGSAAFQEKRSVPFHGTERGTERLFFPAELWKCLLRSVPFRYMERNGTERLDRADLCERAVSHVLIRFDESDDEDIIAPPAPRAPGPRPRPLAPWPLAPCPWPSRHGGGEGHGDSF